jgi:hypothetical protein
LSLPPLECCFGTSPIRAEKFSSNERKEQRNDEEGDAPAAYEKLREAMKLLASAGLPLLVEEVEELTLQG